MNSPCVPVGQAVAFRRLSSRLTKTVHKLRWTVLLSVSLFAQPPADSRYTRTDSMIPMRDGVKLYTQVFTPNNTTEQFPFLLIRTPYGSGNLDSARLVAAMPELAADGYIFVMQDIRGRFKSEGQFVMLRQPRDPADKNALDESTDT